jgi:two-component system response regulator
MNPRQNPILLVEDNADDEELTLMALKEAGVQNAVHIARDGAEALAYLFGAEDGETSQRQPLPTLILLDLMLPKVNGFEVLEKIRETERTRYIPVVILTSSDADADVARSYRLGVNSYVRKPVEFSEFVGAVRQVGLYWVLLNKASREGT